MAVGDVVRAFDVLGSVYKADVMRVFDVLHVEANVFMEVNMFGSGPEDLLFEPVYKACRETLELL